MRYSKLSRDMGPYFSKHDLVGPRSGMDHPCSKVTPEMKKTIRERYLAGESVAELAAAFNLANNTVRDKIGHLLQPHRRQIK